MNCKVTR